MTLSLALFEKALTTKAMDADARSGKCSTESAGYRTARRQQIAANLCATVLQIMDYVKDNNPAAAERAADLVIANAVRALEQATRDGILAASNAVQRVEV